MPDCELNVKEVREMDYRFKLDLYGLSNENKAKVVSNFMSSVLSLIDNNIIFFNITYMNADYCICLESDTDFKHLIPDFNTEELPYLFSTPKSRELDGVIEDIDG
jgi:hypothetical protein